jgi:hypothetical protein
MAIKVASYETNQLAERLKKQVAAECYDIIPYEELSNLIGRDVQKDPAAYGYLRTARAICERDTNRLVDAVAGEGIKVLTPHEQAALGAEGIARLKRFTNRRLDRMARVQYDKLEPTEKVQHNLAASVFGAVQLFSRQKSIEKLTSAVQKATDKLAIGDTLKLFSS